MKLSSDHKGCLVEAMALPVNGRWGYRYDVDGLPRKGRGFRAKHAAPDFATEHDALRAAFDAAKSEIEAFNAISEIESSVDALPELALHE